MGIDVGDKRVGVAFSDASGTLATPFETFSRGGGKAEKTILSLIKDRGILTVVAGLPLSDSGEETIQSEKIRQFCRRLQRRAGIVVQYQDEYSSSKEALFLSREAGKTPGRKEKGLVDARAAAVILQAYLNTHCPE